MIVECEKCNSKFELDDSLIKDKGSKVRCSVCKDVFKVYPQKADEPESAYESESMDEMSEDLQETVALDSPPDFSSKEELDEDFGDAGFEDAFEEALDDGAIEDVSLDEMPEESDETIDMNEALDRAAQIEEEVTKEDIDGEEEFDISEKPDQSEAPRPKKKAADRKPKKLLFIILIIVVLVCLAGTAVVMWAPNLLPDSLSFLKPAQKLEISDTGVRQLDFKGVSGAFFESKKLGRLFVIKGDVINKYPKSRSSILLRGVILNEKGEEIKVKMVRAGNPFTDVELNQLSIEEIDKASKNKSGKGGINTNIKSGGKVPFMLVFNELPEDLSEFTVEPVSSSPGK